MQYLYQLRILVICVLLATIWQACNTANSTSATKGTTDSGYDYLHYIQQEGPKPQVGEYAYFHYTRRLDDSLMETSRRTSQMPKMLIPDMAQVGQQPPNPILDGLKIMSKGDSLSIIIPLDSLQRVPPSWENKENMYFDIVLVDIKDKTTYEADIAAERAQQQAAREAIQAREAAVAAQVQQTLTDYQAGKLKDQLKTSASGLKYLIHETGEGPNAAARQRVSVQYYGMLTNGTMFDNSLKRGQAFEFMLGTGSVIKGWDEGIAYLNKGAKATFFIPSQLGYGDTGSPPTIPPKSELVFYVELEDIK